MFFFGRREIDSKEGVGVRGRSRFIVFLMFRSSCVSGMLRGRVNAVVIFKLEVGKGTRRWYLVGF